MASTLDTTWPTGGRSLWHPERRHKHAPEGRDFFFDFAGAPEVAGGETLSAPAVVATTTDDGLVIGAPAVSGGKVAVELSSGTPGYTYTLRCTVTTSGGATLLAYGRLYIQEAPP